MKKIYRKRCFEEDRKHDGTGEGKKAVDRPEKDSGGNAAPELFMVYGIKLLFFVSMAVQGEEV